MATCPADAPGTLRVRLPGSGHARVPFDGGDSVVKFKMVSPLNTGTAGTTDHVFGMCHLLGHRFAPHIKDLKDRKLYRIEKPDTYPVLKPLIGETVDTAAIIRGWGELQRVRASIQAGAVAPSTILRKLAAAGPNNVLGRALRAIGRIERTLFTLQWLSDPALRQRSHAGPCGRCRSSGNLTLA